MAVLERPTTKMGTGIVVMVGRGGEGVMFQKRECAGGASLREAGVSMESREIALASGSVYHQAGSKLSRLDQGDEG
jgi:hypothetical protein